MCKYEDVNNKGAAMTAKQHIAYRSTVFDLNQVASQIRDFGDAKAPQNLEDFYALKKIFNLSVSLKEYVRIKEAPAARDQYNDIGRWQKAAKEYLANFYEGFLVNDRFSRVIAHMLTNSGSKYGGFYPAKKLYAHLKDKGMLRKSVVDGEITLYCTGIYRSFFIKQSGRSRIMEQHFERLAIEFSVEYGEGLDIFSENIPPITPEFTVAAKAKDEPWALTNAAIKKDDEIMISQWCGFCSYEA